MIWKWFHSAICEHLEAVARRDITRLIVNIPPRLTKSFLGSVFFPSWVWTWKPSAQFLCVSAMDDVVNRDGLRHLEFVQSDQYQDMFLPEWKIKTTQEAKSNFQNTVGGQRLSQPTGRRRQGVDADYIIIDDPHDVIRVLSGVARVDKDVEHLDSSLITRLNDVDTPIVIIMQRLHQSDYTGHKLSETNNKWIHICLPNEFDGKKRKHIVDLGGGKKIIYEDQRKKKGELLCPERVPEDRVKELKHVLHEYGYAAQYQQDPAPPEGVHFNPQWMAENCWTQGTLPNSFDYLLASWDCSYTKSKDSDYVVGQLWGIKKAQSYLLAQTRKKMVLHETIRSIQEQHKYSLTEWGLSPRATIVEAKANGPEVIKALKKEIQGIIPFNPQGESKVGRAQAVQSYIKAGQVHIPDPKKYKWVYKDLMPELRYFPMATHDDQVDALTQALLHIYEGKRFWVASLSGKKKKKD